MLRMGSLALQGMAGRAHRVSCARQELLESLRIAASEELVGWEPHAALSHCRINSAV